MIPVSYDGSNSISVVGERDYWSVPNALDEVEFGIPYFLVVVCYKTGDTFGSREEEEYIELFMDAKLAADLIEKISLDADEYREASDWRSKKKYSGEGEYYLKYIVDSGEERQTSKIWNGYFEQLIEAKMEVVWRKK